MNIFEGVKSIPIAKSVVTIGNFDGVHKGHQTLIRTLVQEAKTKEVRSVVMTFDPHPVQVLYPERKLLRIFDRNDQAEQLSQLGVDNLVIETFDKKLSQHTAQEFLRDFVCKYLQPELLIVGYDFSFGTNRSGSIPQLLEFAKSWGFELMIIPPQKFEDDVISSSRIRKSILDGNMELVSKLLERPFYIRGTIEHGQKRGQSIGIPTANIKYEGDLIFPPGVYVTKSSIGSQTYKSVTNVGVNPTVTEDKSIKIESHLLDFQGDIYGKDLKVEFLKKIRDEKKFSSIEELKKQIKSDILLTKEYYDGA